MTEQERALKGAYLAEAQDEVMNGFRSSVLAGKLTPAIERLMETTFRMGFECGWRIHEGASSPVDKTPASGAASPARTAEGTGASNGADEKGKSE